MNKISNGIVQPTMDKSKDWQLELLMEKLRSKSSQVKTLTEISKSVRMTMLDKRFALDSVDKSQHQRCLDTLQHSIKVTSLQSMVERLESLTRQLGLKFVQGPPGVILFISSDMFFLEIILDESGAVLDVKVHHEGKTEQQSCKELVSCLSRGDFADFTAQLEGFASIYQLNAEKKIKSKAFTALQSLEADLSTLAQLQMFMKEPFNLLHKSPVGILEKRKGGHPMKLTYFVSPYDMINRDNNSMDVMTVEGVTVKNLGYSVTVCMEGSAAHKLQISTLITVNKNHNGKSTPSYAAVTNQNSTVIPACFVLRLNKPMPMCATLVRQVYQITELECADLSTTRPLLSLIASHSSNGKVDAGTTKGLFVTLPDQHHCYFMTENQNMDGILVSSIPFTHPGHVAQILVILRQQALFNTIIASCVRPNSKQDFESMIMFEISALSWTQISISLEHPLEESMATAEIDLSDISNLICRIHSPGTPPPANTPDLATDLATKHLNKSFSVPVTMRSVIRHWERQIARKNHFNGHENFNLPLGSGDPGGCNNHPGGNFGNLDGKIKHEEDPTGGGLPHHNQGGMFMNETLMNSDNFSNFVANDSVLTNMELTNILSGVTDKKGGLKRKIDEIFDASSCDSTSSEIPSDFDGLISDKSDEILKFRKKSPAPIDLPSVSITPISSGKNVDATPAISSVGSSITITPIPSGRSDEKRRDKKRSSDDRNKLEKKRKRMGPPEKIPTKQDLSPPLNVTPNSPGLLGKSPTHNRKISSPNLVKSSSHGSPKHPSTSGSGKPSMSTLKNAANSPSGKSDSGKKSSGKDSSREKDKRSSSGIFGSNSAKKSTVKVKQLDLNAVSEIHDGLTSPTGSLDLTKNSSQARNRKGLLAVIDQLKVSLHSDVPTDLTSKNNKTKNSEYQVKPSSDGMKITINKTRTKDSKTSSSSSNSPKSHTGLKPGVNSGPASKKPQQITKSSSSKPPINKPLNKSSNPLKSSKSTTTDFRVKPKQPKPEKFFNKDRRGSPTLHEDSKVPKIVEVKTLDTNFQIPKLSARGSDNDKKPKNSDANSIRMNNDFGSDDERKFAQNMTSANLNMSYTKSYEALSLTAKFVAPAPKEDKKKDLDGLIDYSKDSKVGGGSISSVGFPQSPSVSVHIVKSPAPSPMVNPSPHSTSSCITDDELMDEALMSLGGK